MSHKITIMFETPNPVNPIEKIVAFLSEKPDETLIADLEEMASFWGPSHIEIGDPDERRVEEFNRIMEDLQMQEALDECPVC
jgi:hypothetical protein